MLKRVDHLLNPTIDIAATISFYEGVLGLPLIAAERRPVRATDVMRPSGPPRNLELLANEERLTALFAMSGGGRLAFVELPELRELPVNPLPRWIKHLAMRVSDVATLREAERRLRAAGIEVLGPVDHKLLESIYFFDPVNGIRLEFTTPHGELDDEDARLAWEALERFERGERPRNRAFH